MLYTLDVTIHIVGNWNQWFLHTALASLQVPGGIGKRKTNPLNHEKSLMFKYRRMQRKIPSRLVYGSCGTCLDCTLIVWGSSHCWAGIFVCVQIIIVCEDYDSLLYRLRPPCMSLVGQQKRKNMHALHLPIQLQIPEKSVFFISQLVR